MYENIVSIANERMVTAEDFAPYINERNWLTLDAGDLPGDDGKTSCITEFFVRRIDSRNNAVQIGAYYGHGIHRTWVGIWIDADELAVRMEDA